MITFNDERRERKRMMAMREAAAAKGSIAAAYNRMRKVAPGTPLDIEPETVNVCETCNGLKKVISAGGTSIKDCPDCGATGMRDARLTQVAKWSAANGRSTQQTFETFQAGDSAVLQVALTAARGWASGEGLPWLTLTGSPGTGKSHLASAAVNELLARGEEAIYTTAPELMISLRSTFDNESGDSALSFADLMARYCRCAWLVIDDFGAEKPSDWTDEIWFTIVNARYRDRLPLLITSNLALKRGLSATRVDMRLIDRLNEMGLGRVVEVKTHSWRASSQL